MSSDHRLAPTIAAVALVAFAALAPRMARAMPATVDYRCHPALSGGDTLTIDYNSGGHSINVQFPDGKSVRMTGRTQPSYFYFSGGHGKVYGKQQKTITLTTQGQPTRRCVAISL